MEEICDIEYVNKDHSHVLITVKNPTLTNSVVPTEFWQAAISIDNAIILRAQLNAFLEQHGIVRN